MAVTLNYALTGTVIEVPPTNATSLASNANSVQHTAFNEAGTLTSVTTPPVTLAASFIATLSSGTLTIDLTALTGLNGATVDGTGLRVQFLRVKNLGANTLNITAGASNGWDALDGDFEITIPQNAVFAVFPNDAGSNISSGYKTIDLAGTGAQTSEWTIVLG